jgi:putative addiction module killer protein
MFELRFWQDARGRTPVRDWFEALAAPQKRTVARLLGLLERLGPQLALPYARNLGGGLWELRDTGTGPGMRVYYGFHGQTLVLLVAAGQKSSQARDIERARRILDGIEKEDR